MKIAELEAATKIAKIHNANLALQNIKKNVKISGSEIVPASFFWRLMWRLIRPILAAALHHIADALDKPIKDLLK